MAAEVTCPKGWGKVKFDHNPMLCPISLAGCCKDCKYKEKEVDEGLPQLFKRLDEDERKEKKEKKDKEQDKK